MYLRKLQQSVLKGFTTGFGRRHRERINPLMPTVAICVQL